MQDNISKFYGAFSKKYDNFKSEQEFRDYLKGAKMENIDNLYRAFSSKYDNFGSADDMISYLGWSEGGYSGRPESSGRQEQAAAPVRTDAPSQAGTPASRDRMDPGTSSEQTGTPAWGGQSWDWKAISDDMRRSVMPGEPVSMPEAPAEKEPEGNPFPYRGGLEKEMREKAKAKAEAAENIAGDLDLIKEYERRLKETENSLDPTSRKTKENVEWLRAHKEAYTAAKWSGDVNEYARAKADYDETARAVGNAEEKIAERKNREEMASPAEVIATGKTVFGGDNAGRSDSEYRYRKMADELYKSADKEYGWSSKNDEGYNGGFMDKLWTATKQFAEDAGNNVDSGSLTFGLSKGLAEKEAREVGDKYNGIITGVLKDMKMSDGDISAVMSSLSANGAKLQEMDDELKAENAEIDTMASTYEDMVRRGDPNAKTYGAELQKKIDAYNRRINEEYKPLVDQLSRDKEAYDTVMSAIDSAVESGLTGGEKALLDAMERFTEAKTLSEPVRSTASKAGAGAEQSAEFMLDFILTGGISKAGAKAATKIATNRALKKYGAGFLKDLAAVGRTVKPGLGLRLGTDVVTSLARTGVMFPRTLQAYGDNLTEYSGKDAAGRIEFDRSQANALGNSLLTQFIEYWSEGFGEYFGEAERALFRNVTKRAPMETIGGTLRGYRGSIGNYLDKGKFDGMFNEMLEEVVGSAFNALSGWMSGDRVGDAGAMKEFFAGENLATLALSFLPMSAIGAATNVSAYHKMKQRYDAGVKALNQFIESGAISRAELDQLSKDIPNMTPNQIKDKIVDISDRARKANGGQLPSDFAQNLLGYIEGDFAMGLRYDEWEDSQEKMAVVNSYTSNYSNPDPRDAWDLNYAANATRNVALEAGFSEDDLENDPYVLAQEAFEMQGTRPERADILMNYATAKAGLEGLQNGYRAQGEQISQANADEIRENADVNGRVVTATVMEYGVPKAAFILSDDAIIAPDGTVSTPTGNGVVRYRVYENGRYGKEGTIMSDKVSGARTFDTDRFIENSNEFILNRRNEIYDKASREVSPTGMARALYDRIGHTVIVDDESGVYEPFMVESMTDDGTEVVISGDRKALQGVARRMNLEIPPAKYLKAPVTSLYPLLAKDADGVSLTTGLGEKPEETETEAAQAEQPATEQAPAQEAAPAQTEGVGDLRDRTVPIFSDGQVRNAHVLDVSDGSVIYEELDENGDVTRTVRLPENMFAQAMQETENPAPAAEEQAPVVEEEPVVEEPAQPAIPVDDKTGEKVYDAPGVSVEDAIADLYATEGLSEADVDQYIAERAATAEANRNPERGSMSPQAWGQAKQEAARVADFWSAMRQAAEARKQQTEAPAAAEEAPAAQQGAPIASEAQPTEESAPAETGDSVSRKMARRLKRWQKRTGVKVKVFNSPEEVTNEQAREALEEGRTLTGWFDADTGEVGIYLPNISSEAELDASFIHEVVSHKGLRELLGEQGYNELCDRVWNELMTEGDKRFYVGYNRHLDAVGDAQRRAAADEYIARLSENLDFYDNRSIFQKLVDWIKRILGQELSVDELEYDAMERATGATPSMNDETLRLILADSMKRYVETTRGGRRDAEQKNDISSEVGGSMETDESGGRKGQTRFSMKSIVAGGGLGVVENDGKGNVAFVTTDGRTFNAEHPITARDLMSLENTVMYHMMKDARDISHLSPQKERRIWQAYADQLNAFLQKGVAKDGLEGADRLKALWQWEVENSVYRSVAPNSDEQYKYSLDITRVCKKNEATIRAISAMQRKIGAGLTPGQVMDVYMAGIEEGYQVPCPVCYVFSRYINNGIVATIAINGQKKWGADLVDPSTLSDEEKRERIAMWKSRLDEQEAFNEQNKKKIEQAKKDCSVIIEEIDNISEQITSGKLKGKERAAAEKRVRLLDNRYRAAFDLVSQSALTQWIKQFAIRQTKNGYAPTEDGKRYELWPDTFQGFPDEYALDLRLTAETIEKYPAIQRLRKARGAAGGKEIHFESNNDVGDIPMMLGADNSVNFYQKAVNARTPKERDYFLSKATERFKNAHKYAQQQSLRGGQRMWSWSDNIERLAPDVFVNLLQLQMLGGALQSYSKQLEGVNLVASLQGYVNGSLMGYGKGWTELKPEDVEVVDGREVLARDIKDTVTEKVDGGEVTRDRYLAKKGSPVVTVDGKKVTLLFDDVVGIDAYGRDLEDGTHLKGLFDLNGELDKAGNILVGMNDTHIIAAMADDRVFFIIPWHASGNSIHQVQQMLNGLGVKTMVKDYMDYTKVQEEKDMDKKKKGAEEADFVDEDVDVSKEEKIEEAEPIRQEIIDFWESHKNESDRVEKGLPLIPSGENGKLSKAQKRYRKLRDAIFDGLFDELPKEDQDEITSDAFLSQVLRKVNEVVDDREMTAGDKKFIYPYEYWNEQSTYDTADENGARYLEYCRRLGYKPKFVGKLDRKAKTDFGNFADYKGYWKLLIDRRMYDVKGRFQDLDPVTTDNYDPRTVDPQWTEQNFPKTTVADDLGAERIADRTIEKEGRTFKDGVPAANYEGDIRDAVKKYDMASRLVDLKPAKPKKSKKGTQFRDVSEEREAYAEPQVSEGGVTMFRERTAPAPQKTQEVYKLMRLGEDGELYPLFIDSASPIELKKWYDADSPALKDVESLPSDTYTGIRDVKDDDGNKIGEEEYRYGVYIVDNETGEATSLADFKAAHKGDKTFSSMRKNPSKAAINWATDNGMRWIKIEEKKTAQKRYGGSNRAYYNYGINGSGGVGTFAMRPGWHAGSLPSMRQIGKGSGKNLRDDRFVWVKGYVPADIDYNEEAQGNPDKDIPTHIPENGYYLKATNANAEASQADRIGWYVAGSFYPERIMSDSEAKSVIDRWNKDHPNERVKYDWPRESGKVFNAETMQLEDADNGPDDGGTRFRIANQTQNGFISNAEAALDRIKMEKATPEQWVKMLEKEGGLKAGEDKWLGLSDWLKSQDKKTLTKQEVADYIAENRIQIEELNYAEEPDIPELKPEFLERYPGFEDAFTIDVDEFRNQPYVDTVNNLDAALKLYNDNHDEKLNLDYVNPSEGRYITDEDLSKILGFGRELFKDGFDNASAERINSTRLNYTTDGLENKREIALVIPTVEPYHGSAPEIHFDDKRTGGRAIAWSRFGDTVDENGNRVLVIDEIQSQRHEDAREAGGYKTEDRNEALENARAELSAAIMADDAMMQQYLDYTKPMKDRLDAGEITRAEFADFLENDSEAVSLDKASEDAHRMRMELQDKVNDLRRISEEKNNRPAPAPFEKNWHELAMKRMLRLAAEEGYDYVAWTTGEQQAERYNIGSVVKKVSAGMDQERKRHTMLNVDANGMSGITTLTHDDDGNITGVSGSNTELFADAKNLADVVGKEMAADILTISEPGSANMKEYKGKDLRIGGEGMKGFYDEILPRFMNKYGKKWGVKVQDITLPNVEEAGRTMHAVPVTQEMKESVMQGQTMFRTANPSTGNAQVDYEKEIRNAVTRFMVEWQDGDIPVRIAMNKVMAEVGMERISDDMDYLTRHNLASSIADAQMHQYKLFYYEPMMKTVSEIVDKLLGRKYNIVEKLTGQKRAKQDEVYKEIVNFCYAMSGLERNAWKRAEAAENMRKELDRLAEKWEKESEDIHADSRLSEEERDRSLKLAENMYLREREKIEAKYAPRDYSGITGLMGRPAEEWQEAEADAQNMIDAFRDRLGDNGKIDELWDRIRACTDFNLEHAYKYGLLTRTEYEKLHGTESQPRLWNYYMPLRGFAEATAEDVYSYSMFTSDLSGGKVVEQAKGRVTEAEDPFATMRHISEKEVIDGMNNWARQALYNFVLTAGDNSLLTPVEPWYVKESGSDKWEPAEPKDDETLEKFEARMQEAYSKGEARKGRNGLKLGLIMGNPMHRNQHMIRLKVNGQEKMIWVNGSPVLAQSVNGVRGWDNDVVKGWRALNRSLSQFYTTYSAKFLSKNKMRDTQFSRIAALVDESQPYLRKLEKNWWANNGYVAGGYPMIRLVAEWNSGKLEKKENRTEREQMFIDFMYDGGATGYTMRTTMDRIKRDLEKMVKNAGRGERNIPVIDWYAKGVGALNEASELLTRFTFYQTSRQMGRSRQRAAYDAKESSVNFNRRGLRSGQGVAGWTAAAASMLYLFMNPAIQGLDKFVRLHKEHPWSMGVVDATYFMMGFFNSMMNAMLAGVSDGGDGGDDDGEEKMGPDWYWNIPEWVRRGNMIIASPFKKLGKWGYLVIALPVEYKGFYAMGELASSIFQKKLAVKDTPTIANEVVGVVAELLPINPVEGYTPGDNVAMSLLRNIAPDAVAPIVDVATNRSFAGIPLWKENIYDETEPLSQSAFASTPEILNRAVIKLSEATADKPWHVDIPSGAIRGLLKGYGGGAYNFVEDTGKFIFADEAHPRRYENFPFVGGFSGYLDEDRRDSFNSNALRRYKALSKDVVKRIRSAAPGEDITESMVYNHPEELPKKANACRILIYDKWLLGQMYFNGMKERSGATETHVDKRGNVRTVGVKDDISALRKEWKKAKDKYLEIAGDKNATDEEKKDALDKVQEAWVRFTDSEDALVDKLMQEEYDHVSEKIKNGVPYEPEDTWSEKAYKWTNRK